MSRFKDALAIQAGACNPIAVSRALVRAIDACHAEGLGTDAICADPAVRLIVHQLAFLVNIDEINVGFDTYRTLTAVCEAQLRTLGVACG